MRGNGGEEREGKYTGEGTRKERREWGARERRDRDIQRGDGERGDTGGGGRERERGDTWEERGGRGVGRGGSERDREREALRL